ncbi:MAG TPA: Maf family protein [Bdellovibrionota bacterium]|jgi:septum formation protein|nr:Maf family protein [Bdellovibrionota bacterium]
MRPKNKVFLASGSPRRLELLQNLGCCVAQIKVPFLEPKGSNYKDPLAFMKRCVQDKHDQAVAFLQSKKEIHNDFEITGQLALVADTIVALGSEVLGKPAEKIEAFETLKKLSGRTHEVFTGYSLWITCAKLSEPPFFRTKTVVTKVKFKTLNEKFICDYIRSGEPMDKAGSYGLQSMGLQLIDSIEGSYSGVMGLPLAEVLQDLRAAETFLGRGVLS